MSAGQKCDNSGCYLGSADWGFVGRPNIRCSPPVRRERHWDIEISKIFELLQFCSRRVVVLCFCMIERFRADRKGDVWR